MPFDLTRYRYLGLVAIGAVILMGSAGTVTSDFLGFEPSETLNKTARFVFLTMGGLLILGGLTMALRETQIYGSYLSGIHLCLNIVVIFGFAGVIFYTEDPAIQSSEPVFKNWDARESEFVAVIDMKPYEEYADSYDALLVCRKLDPTIPEEKDQRIIVSTAYPFHSRTEKKIIVPYDQEFREALRPGDQVECHLALIPNDSGAPNDIESLQQLEVELAGKRLDKHVRDDVCIFGFPSESSQASEGSDERN